MQTDLAERLEGAAALDAEGRSIEAVAALELIARDHPDSPLARHRLGAAWLRAGEAAAAAARFREALALQPDFVAPWIGLGAALRQLGEPDAAIAVYRRAIALDGGAALAHYNLANLLQELDDPAAEAAYRHALALRPDWPSAHYNHGIWLLKHGRYETGWAEYEWRWRTERFQPLRRALPCRQWAGQPLAGKTVLVHPEQGLGDLVQFVRYAPLIAERGGAVVLEAPEALHALFAGLPGVVEMLAPGGATSRPLDYHCPYLSLPLGFGTRLETIPATVPYLTFAAGKAAGWLARLPEGYRVGVVWQGNPAARVERGRSFPLAALAPVAKVPGVRLISLQKGHGLDQLVEPGFEVTGLGEAYDRGDFAETAAVVAALDLVITCDTAVGHLAGALGRPVWLALRSAGEWRWLTRRTDSPWYPHHRLYRQAAPGDWSGVFDRMAQDLADATGA
jgi:hypothetical protein